MLSDDRSYIRELELRKILKARETNTHKYKSNVRRFRVSKINFQAKDYYKLIDWSDITDPPILSHLHAAVIQEKVRKNDFSFIDVFPSHTPSV